MNHYKNFETKQSYCNILVNDKYFVTILKVDCLNCLNKLLDPKIQLYEMFRPNVVENRILELKKHE